MTEEIILNIIKPDNWAQVTQLIRQNPEFLEVLNEINARFDKPIFLDDKDWLQAIFSTLFNFLWQDENGGGLIITHHIFSEPNLTRGTDGEKLRAYFYVLPNIQSDKIKIKYEENLEKLFGRITEGVQIHGNSNSTKTKQTTIKPNGKPTKGHVSTSYNKANGSTNLDTINSALSTAEDINHKTKQL